MNRYRHVLSVARIVILLIGCLNEISAVVAQSVYLTAVEPQIDKSDVIAIVHSSFASGQISGEQPRFYPITVDKSWKGEVKPGEQVYIDRSLKGIYECNSDQTVTHIVFLKVFKSQDSKPSEDEKQFALLSEIRLGDASFDHECKIRFAVDPPPLPSAVQKQIFDAFKRLLDVHFKEKPANMEQFWRKLLAEETNPILLVYAADRLPIPLSSSDADLLVQTILRMPKEFSAINRLLSVIRTAKYPLDSSTLRMIVDTSGLHNEMLFIANADNIAGIQQQLFQRITTLDDFWYDNPIGLSNLARFAPDYVKQQLRARQYPFEIEIPLLRILGINGSDIGRPDYPQQMIEANIAILTKIGRMLRGQVNPDIIKDTMKRLQETNSFRELPDWKVLAPLMSPLLSSPKSEYRIQTAAFLRSLGYTVHLDGQNYMLDQQAGIKPVPLTVDIIIPTQPLIRGQNWTAQYVVTAHADRVVILTMPNFTPNELHWQIQRVGENYPRESGVRRIGRLPKLIELKNDETVRGESRVDGSIFKEPGKYRITLSLVYEDTIGEAGVEAWSGTIASKTVEVEVQ